MVLLFVIAGFDVVCHAEALCGRGCVGHIFLLETTDSLAEPREILIFVYRGDVDGTSGAVEAKVAISARVSGGYRDHIAGSGVNLSWNLFASHDPCRHIDLRADCVWQLAVWAPGNTRIAATGNH